MWHYNVNKFCMQVLCAAMNFSWQGRSLARQYVSFGHRWREGCSVYGCTHVVFLINLSLGHLAEMGYANPPAQMGLGANISV